MYKLLGGEFSASLFYLVVGVGPLLLHVLIAHWLGSRRQIITLVLLLVGIQFALSLIPVRIGSGESAEVVGGLDSLRPAALFQEVVLGIAWLALAGVFLIVERGVRAVYTALLRSK